MVITVTKAQMQAIIAVLPTSTVLMYCATMGNLVNVAIGWYSIGWNDFIISGAYSTTDFLDDTDGFTVKLATSVSA